MDSEENNSLVNAVRPFARQLMYYKP